MQRVYLGFAVLGTALPMLAFAPWLAEYGFDLDRFAREMFATRIAAFFSLDVLVSALLVLVLVTRAARRGVSGVWFAAVGTLLVGVSLGLPLYLYLEARHSSRG